MGTLIAFILSGTLVVSSVRNYLLLMENGYCFINQGTLSIMHFLNIAVFVGALIVAVSSALTLFTIWWGYRNA